MQGVIGNPDGGQGAGYHQQYHGIDGGIAVVTNGHFHLFPASFIIIPGNGMVGLGWGIAGGCSGRYRYTLFFSQTITIKQHYLVQRAVRDRKADFVSRRGYRDTQLNL